MEGCLLKLTIFQAYSLEFAPVVFPEYDKKLHPHLMFNTFFNCKDNFKFRPKANHSYHCESGENQILK